VEGVSEENEAEDELEIRDDDRQLRSPNEKEEFEPVVE